LQNWQGSIPTEEIWVAEIDPAAAGGKELSERYGLPISIGANCVIVEATLNEKKIFAACVALANCKMNFNRAVKKALNARKISFAPLPQVLEETEMEFGSITPFGLPSHWPILLDAQIIQLPRIIIGSGLLKSKLSLPGKALAELPGAIVVEGLGSMRD
jgi:prolyl-tRNA editing enzyme YbaK/EbsC (Cys-tRNA(Pro) deacylase)